MRKILILLVVGILLASGLGISATSAETDTKIEKKQLSFSKPIINQEKEYTTLEIKEANSYLMEQNKPMLPTYTHTFTYPFNTDIKNVECTIKQTKQIEITKQIQPTPEIVSTGLATETRKETSYNINEPYPEKWYEYDIGTGIIDNKRSKIVKVTILPAKYNPTENYIEWAEEVEIKVEYKTTLETTNNDEQYDLIILTPGKYNSQLQPLITHKNNRGLSTKPVTLNEISLGTYFPAEGRDDIEEIKHFIKNAIENWEILNVLIVGGADDFPARETHILMGDSDDEIFVTDLYYADIYDEENNFASWDTNENDIFAEYNWDGETDEMDLYPDVRVGRLATTDSGEVTTVVNKIINYENNEAYAQNWFNNIVVIGGDSAPDENDDPDGIDYDEGEVVNQAVLDIMEGFIPDKIWDSNNRLGGIAPSGTKNINNGINRGCGFVDWSGHGAPTVWTTYPHNVHKQILPSPYPPGVYYNYYHSDLTNGDKLPIVMCGGCSLGNYEKLDDCFAWQYITNPDGGAIATFGASGLGWIYVGKYVTEGLVEGFMVDLYEAYADGAITLGEMWSEAANNYLPSRPGDGDHKTITELHLFGDPTLKIAEESQPPQKPETPSGPASGKVGEEYTYTSSTTDPDDDELYYLFDWGDGTYSSWVGPYNSGDEASATHTWSVKDDNYQIRVKSKDRHGVQSEWSNPLVVSMPKTKMHSTPIFEKIMMFLQEYFPNIIDFLT